MTIELTAQQQMSLDAAGEVMPRLVDPRTGMTYLLVPETSRAIIEEALDDERQQQGIRAIGRRNAVARMNEES